MQLNTLRPLIAGYLFLALSGSAAAILLPYSQDPVIRALVATTIVFILSLACMLLISRRLEFAGRQEREQLFKLNISIDAGREAVWEWHLDKQDKTISFSPAYCSMLGYEPREFAGNQQQWQDYLHPDERERIYKKVMQFITDRSRDYYENTYRIRHRNGSYRWIHSRGRILFDEHGNPLSLLGMAADVTSKRVDQDRLQQANAVFESTHEGVLISDHTNTITFVNPAFSQITGYDSSEVIGKNPRIFKSGRHTKEFYSEMWSTLEKHGHWSGEVWNRRKNGEILPQLQTIRLIRDENGLTTYNVAVFTDISLLKRSQSELSFLAHYDPLTNLSNRLLLHEHIKLALHRANKNQSEAALFIIDLDHFKNINESLGHSLGDELIKATAERLNQFLESNATLSRFGGDEFAVVFENINSAAEAATLAQQLLTLFDAAFTIDTNELFVTASIGICLFPRSGKSSEEIFRNADSALSKAKAIGRATFAFYTTELTDQAYHRLRIASELRYALENSQLRVYYQPVYSLSEQRIIGCEALVRWQHPERGMISPLDFIPIAEDNGLIGAFDSWVLHSSCQQLKNWLDSGQQLRFVAVNISSKLFGRADFTERITRILQETQLNPNCLELEITESAVMENPKQADLLLAHLCDINIRLALDDFGTGYSSLSRLKSLPVHKLKIDQSFIRNLPADSREAAIDRAIIALGDSMHLDVQAEGIETPEQAAFLKQNNCILAQGYYYGKPMPAQELEALLVAQKT